MVKSANAIFRSVCERLEGKGIEDPELEARFMFESLFGENAYTKLLTDRLEIDGEDLKTLDEYVDRRIDGEPLQYILGEWEFYGLSFKVGEGVLIPRQDTETLVECVLENAKDCINLLDIGTGTGCIPLSVAYYNKKARVRGLDINESAITLANRNAEKLHLKDRAVFEKLDILTQIPNGKYDVVTSNPPYIETHVIPTLQEEVRDYEPHLALDGGSDGLVFYRRICHIAPQFLNPGGLLIFEIGYDQGESVSKLMEERFEEIQVIRDLAGCNRVVIGRVKAKI